MREIYPGRGDSYRTWDHEVETDEAFRTIEIPRQVERDLSIFANNVGSSPATVVNELATRWLNMHSRDIVGREIEVDHGQPYDEWRIPDEKKSTVGILRTFIFNISNLTGILSHAEDSDTAPAEIVGTIIVDELRINSTL